MATVLEMYKTEEQSFDVRFLWAKTSMQWIFIKKCFLFYFIASGVELSPLYCGHFWPILSAR
jgi:hypothetical protein